MIGTEEDRKQILEMKRKLKVLELRLLNDQLELLKNMKIMQKLDERIDHMYYQKLINDPSQNLDIVDRIYDMESEKSEIALRMNTLTNKVALQEDVVSNIRMAYKDYINDIFNSN